LPNPFPAWLRSSCLIGVILILTSCTPAARPEFVKFLGGSVGVSTLKEATSVRAYRVEQVFESYDQLTQYTMTDGPLVVSQQEVEDLRKVVLDSQTYLWDVAKSCDPPAYGVRFEFATSDHRVDIMICYACDYLGVYVNGKLVDYEDCDNGRVALVAVAKAVFPQDGEIA
jgi:hypothetical protein